MNGQKLYVAFALSIAAAACDEGRPLGEPVLLCAGSNALGCDEAGTYCRERVVGRCPGVEVFGECAEQPEVCADISDPACGCDGETYANDCEAAASGVALFAEGECGEAP
jgi:hypothetical protein